jgi:ATP-dependent Lon protease
MGENPGLYRIETNVGPGSGVKILNRPAPQPFSESVRYAEQNFHAQGPNLVGGRDPRAHEFTTQLRSFDASKDGTGIGVAVLVLSVAHSLRSTPEGGSSSAGR